MGLDVSLYSVEKKKVMCYSCMHEHEEQEMLHDANITHNLTEMANRAGIYKALWRPDEIGAKYAKDIVEIVEKGLGDLKARPEYFEKFNSSNGWGTYEHFVPFVSDYLDALKENHDSEIRTGR